MKRYLVQARNSDSGDSSHIKDRFIVLAKDIIELQCQLDIQKEYDVLASEDVSENDPIHCEMGNHQYMIMFNKGKCKICGKIYEAGDE